MKYSVKWLEDNTLKEVYFNCPIKLYEFIQSNVDTDSIIEEWKWVNGYHGMYKISNLGRIKSYKGCSPKLMKKRPTKFGYLRVCLYGEAIKGQPKNHNRRSYLIHVLVAEHFCHNSCPDIFDQVDHINRLRDDDVFYNLRWTDYDLNQENKGNRDTALPF